MKVFPGSRRDFLKTAGMTLSASSFSLKTGFSQTEVPSQQAGGDPAQEASKADYTPHIKTSPIEIAPNRIISVANYNGQFPGPLLRFKEGQQVTIDILNDTDVSEQLHWHGQKVPVEVDGASVEGTPYIPAGGKRRVIFVPQPAGFRFYHTHNRAGANLSAGQYSGQVGPVYIEPKGEPGNYDREVFLVLKEFDPEFSHGGDMAPGLLLSSHAC